MIQLKFALAGLLFSSLVLAKEMKIIGYPRKPHSRVISVDASVVKIMDDPDSFSIALSGHSAFYIFPKSKNSDQVKKFLQESLKKKKIYTWSIDPFKRNIYEVKELEIAQK